MSQSIRAWYPHEIDAWQGSAAVQDMTDGEYRAYHNLLMAQFQSHDGMLPADEKELAKLSRKRADWANVREAVMEQFEDGGNGRVYNARMFRDWKRAQEVIESRRRGAAETNSKRAATRPAEEPHSPTESVSERPTQRLAHADRAVITTHNNTTQEQETLARPASSDRPSRHELELVYLAYPRHVGKVKALVEIAKAVEALRAGGTLPAMDLPGALKFLHDRAVAFARSAAGQQGEYTPHPSTWFHQERYFDNEQEWQRNGADRQRQGEHGGVAGSPAEQRRERGRSAIHDAFADIVEPSGGAGAGCADGAGADHVPGPRDHAGSRGADAGGLDGDCAGAWPGRAEGSRRTAPPVIEVPPMPRGFGAAGASGARAAPVYAG